MSSEDKPFVCVKSRWGMNIRPRNAAGWIAFGWWMLAFAVATLLHLWAVAAWPDRPAAVGAATLVYVAFVIGWVWNMICWMLARSVIITRD